MEDTHSLEDWIAVKANLFHDSELTTKRLHFIVGWNHIEQKVCITCSEGSRKASDKRPNSLAGSLRYANVSFDFLFIKNNSNISLPYF